MQYTACLIILILVALSAAVGQILFKKAAVKQKPLMAKFLDPCFLLGCVAFLVGPPLSVVAATRLEFSVLYTMTALNYIFVLSFSRVFLKEPLDPRKMIGVSLIVAGLIVYGFGWMGQTDTNGNGTGNQANPSRFGGCSGEEQIASCDGRVAGEHN